MTKARNPEELILGFINEELLFGEAEASADEDLLESGLVDSINVFGIVEFVGSTFGFEVEPQDIVIENFGSVEKMVAYVSRRLKSQ